MPLSTDEPLAKAVRADPLIPRQRRADRQTKIRSNFFSYHTLKHPGVSEFLGLANYLHSGLLEGDPAVTHYVPRPFCLRVRGQPYTPDYYVCRSDGVDILQISAPDSFPEAQAGPLRAFLAIKEMQFKIIPPADILARETEARNWIVLVHCLVANQSLTTDLEEAETLHRCARVANARFTLADFVEPTDREHTFRTELAVYRLLHRGSLHADLTAPLAWSTPLWTSPGANDC